MKQILPIFSAFVLVLFISIFTPRELRAQSSHCNAINVDQYNVCVEMQEFARDAMGDSFAAATAAYPLDDKPNWCSVFVANEVATYNENLAVVKEAYGDFGLKQYVWWFNLDVGTMCDAGYDFFNGSYR